MKNKMKKGKRMFIFICILAFIISFVGSAIFKITYQPKWAKKYSVDWDNSIGTIYKDISYGDKESNKFDLYVPKDNSKENYGLIVYLHAGGFTTGDKSGDAAILEWLCSKGYVTAGINYTLRTDENGASVYSQSMEIKEAMPVVVEEAKKLGYNLNEMVISGGSAGGTLAMLYAYRDAEESPIPVKMMFEMVGPSSFFAEDWDVYGLDKSNEAAAGLFGVMLGSEIDKDIIGTDGLQEIIKPISAYAWVNENSVPSVIAYGKYDKICPFKTARHLVNALKDNNVDYKYFEAQHSGHGLQNDSKLYEEFMDTVISYLDKYMPVEK
ncbi:alpha/beta hydrolase [Clostridium sp. DSM 100503]|uniref:alpha/beta hydrolase n=1 Tax=Clostridium sp. DSM 100503 TaxID=2963282 RepID=UPI002149CBD1|nr:alpha/beta hydrolase [Clostridium sp. DSM 100503]MCR1952314.1 alpha/beta hydrolase [Clostridium sp. DSM 100503]